MSSCVCHMATLWHLLTAVADHTTTFRAWVDNTVIPHKRIRPVLWILIVELVPLVSKLMLTVSASFTTYVEGQKYFVVSCVVCLT